MFRLCLGFQHGCGWKLANDRPDIHAIQHAARYIKWLSRTLRARD